MNTTKNTIMKQLPHFSASRCKRCGICTHFCPVNVIDTCDGMPFLADAVACTSCGLCRDMCPDWAVSLEATAVEAPEKRETATAPEGSETANDAKAPVAGKAVRAARETASEPSGNGAGAPETVPLAGD